MENKINSFLKLDDFSLKNCKENFKFYLEADTDLIFLLDDEGCFVQVNSPGAYQLEYSPEELIGKHILELIKSRYRNEFAQRFQKILKLESIYNFDSILISSTGKEVIYEFSCKTIYNKAEVAGLIGIGKNVTVQRNLENKITELEIKLKEANRITTIERSRSNRQKSILDELNRLKNEFVSNVSHELRTPLASIIGFSETIANDKDMPEEMREEFNQIILSEGKRLAKLINDLLDVSKLEGGKIALNKSELDIVELLKEIINNNRKNADNKNLIFNFELPDEKILIYGDKERLTQILNGLINNSIKFTDDGSIKIIMQSFYKEVEIIISDTGVGIPEKDLPYVFEKFYRVRRPGTEIPGTGLGLAFAKQIVDLHKGIISVQSDVNKGTTFIIKLPKIIKFN